MRPNHPAQGSSSDAISARARHITKRHQRSHHSHHSHFQAPQMGLKTPGHRSRGRPFMPAETKPPTPVAARNQTHTRGQGPIGASRLDRLAQPLRRVASSTTAAGGGQQDLMTDGLNTIDGLHRPHPAKHSSPPRHSSTRMIGTRNMIQAWHT